jgi:anthranilate synthase/aminodeoxychorismate synthase-like glutamine amidotransferase
MILVIDNYDSFTYNLVQYLAELGATVKVFRNDALKVEAIEELSPSHILISPGPGRPEDAGISVDVIRRYGGRLPILGVCLGHQAIGYAFGGKIVRAKKLMHGKTSEIHHNQKSLFRALKNPFEATRYHSLVIERSTLPKELELTAWTRDGEVMGVRHKYLCALEGVQFHPESILTREGKALLSNFMKGKASR